ncbi:MAG: tetratricopeptide repeat protein [Bryobacteraceae bacterium]|nr:tetratricopeptide repeat protein [Bryobacteraceae bacterium]
MRLPALIVLTLTAAAVAPAQQPQGQLDASPTLFTVLTAINAAGFDGDLNSPSNHPLREAVRKYVAAKNPPVLAELKAFYAAHRQRSPAQEMSQYVSFALASNGAPAYDLRFQASEIPPDVRELAGFSELLARFHREVDMDDLWKRAQPAVEEALARYQPSVVKAITEVNAYLRHATSGSEPRRFQIYVDLVGAPNQIHARTYAGDYFIVLTPSPQPQADDIRRVYLSFLLDPMALRNQVEWDKKKGLGDLAQPAPLLPDYLKSDFTLLASASLVRAVEARLSPKDRRPELIDRALREGYILAPYFAEKLPEYETQEQSMRLYYPQLIEGVDLRKEDKRLAGIQFSSERAVRVAKTAPRQEPELSEPERLLQEAENLYFDKKLDQARGVYQRLLEASGEKRYQAKAYYGLARIAIFNRDPESAERLFERALAAGPDPADAAWCQVYLGRLSDAAAASAEKAGRPEDAARERASAQERFRTALALPGASEAAKQAAQQGLAAAEKRK